MTSLQATWKIAFFSLSELFLLSTTAHLIFLAKQHAVVSLHLRNMLSEDVYRYGVAHSFIWKRQKNFLVISLLLMSINRAIVVLYLTLHTLFMFLVLCTVNVLPTQLAHGALCRQSTAVTGAQKFCVQSRWTYGSVWSLTIIVMERS